MAFSRSEIECRIWARSSSGTSDNGQIQPSLPHSLATICHSELSRIAAGAAGSTGCADGIFIRKRTENTFNRRITLGALNQMIDRFQLLMCSVAGLLEDLSVGECLSLANAQSIGG